MLTTDYQRVHARRPAGLALTVLVHVALIAGWQMSRHAPPAAGPEPVRARIQWIRLPPPVTALPKPAPRPAPKPARGRPPAASTPVRAAPQAPAAAADATQAPATATSPAPQAASATQQEIAPATAPAAAADKPSAQDILQRAKREAGAVDRALRKENYPYIVAPLDSPTIRMRNKMQAAHSAVAPGVEELGNDSGAPVTRVRGALGTYCLTARSPADGIDAFERKGGIRRTGCPNESSQGGSRGYRTARD